MERGKFLWLNGECEDDLKVWIEYWKKTIRRPHDHPGFLKAFAGSGYQTAAVLFEHQCGAFVLYPFHWLLLNNLEFLKNNPVGDMYIHIISPYGYGGPLYQGAEEHKESVSRDFEEIFNAEMKKRGVISEFVREDLFQDRLVLRNSGEHFIQQDNVVVPLHTIEDCWSGYKSNLRKSIRQAMSFDLKVGFDFKGERFSEFLHIYYHTMKRTGATDGYLFEKCRFETLANTVGTEGQMFYTYVFDDDEIISTGLVIHSQDTVYAFLGGTLDQHFAKHPNEFLKHEVIKWACKEGFKYFVLGGGVKPDDGIFKYKERFAPGKTMPFYLRRVIHDRKKYQDLLERKISFERNRDHLFNMKKDFFPAYLG